MDLPKCYFPLHVYQHHEEKGGHRRPFADYGSFSQVDCYPHKEGEPFVPNCHPQKGVGVIDGLCENLPPLPLSDKPISECHAIKDHILGVDHYEDAIESVTYFLRGVKGARFSTSGKERKGLFQEKMEEYERLTDACLEEPDKSENWENLNENLPLWMKSMVKNYSKTTSAFNDDCLMGFNRDFYQGLLCHKQSDQSTLLFHAAGEKFTDIYMTEVSKIENIQSCKQLSKVTLTEPVFQLKCSNEGLVYAQQKEKCVVITYDESSKCLRDAIQVASLEQTQLSDIAFSPYDKDEMLLSATTGTINLWNINMGCLTGSLHKTLKQGITNSWISCHFAGHPRQIVTSDCFSIEMFDHRDSFNKGSVLFQLSTRFVKPQERLMATDSLGFPHHLVATDFALFLIDQRFPGSPVLQWNTENITAPQILKSCQLSNVGNKAVGGESEWFIFTGSQQPAEVTCYPLHLSNGLAPVTKTLPWRVGKIGDFFENQTSSYRHHWFEMEKHFQSSLAGMTVVEQAMHRDQLISVYQMDSYGDIYFQDFKLSPQLGDPGCYSLTPPSMDEKSAASHRATNFLSAIDTAHSSVRRASTSAVETKGESSFTYSRVESFLKGASYSEPSTSRELKDTGLTKEQFEKLSCSKLKLMDMKNLLRHSGSNTRLLLALKENEDIQEALSEREKDYENKKQALREEYLKSKELEYSMPKINPKKWKKTKIGADCDEDVEHDLSDRMVNEEIMKSDDDADLAKTVVDDENTDEDDGSFSSSS